MGIDTSGLDSLAGLDDLNFGGLLSTNKPTDTVQTVNTGAPLSLPIDLVFEDENNIRSEDNEGFSPESIKELADQILLEGKGIKSPVSVKSPNTDGKYQINHGARRYRAAVLAGLQVIPAFIDDSHDAYDQAIENIQRADLEPMEIAVFIGQREAAGDKINEIAARLGKPAGYVSKHKALLTLPLFLAELYSNGYKNLECLYEMQRACKKHADAIEQLVEAEKVENLTLTKIRAYIAELNAPKDDSKQPEKPVAQDEVTEQYQDKAEGNLSDQGDFESQAKAPEAAGTFATPSTEKATDPDKMKKTIVLVEHDGRAARLMLEKRPTIGYAWIKNEDDGHETEVDLAMLKLTSLIEGA